MNSWDCFDTLIARRYFHPKTVFDEVGRRIGDPNFKQKRISAEKASNKTYADIYARLPNIDPQIELDVELEHNFPIMKNMLKVQDGDLILSDMYLSKEFVEKLLRKCGLTKRVDIIVTPDGKKRGWIWEEVKKKYNIEKHFGDNEKSDVLSANANGIEGILTTEFDFNDIERYVYQNDKQLACWMRYTRLTCPYDTESDIKFWNDQADLNLPVLALATLELPDKKIAFTYRDCHMWKMLYEKMTGKEGIRLDVSRKIYLEPNKYFDSYMQSIFTNDDVVIVDVQGKGHSIKNYFKGNPPKTYYIAGKTLPYINRMIEYNTKSLEKHNCYTEGPIIGWEKVGPIRGENDHPIDVALIQINAMTKAIDAAPYFSIMPNKILLKYLVEKMASNNYTNNNIVWSRTN